MYAQHASAVQAYVLRRSDPATADDVTSEVFLAAWRRIDAVPADALPWLLGTARRLLANARRGSRRQFALRERIGAEPGVQSEPAPSDRSWVVLRALARLNERDRELLLLIGWEGLDAERAARALGLRRRAFDARLYRARRRLSEALACEEAAEEPPVESPAEPQ
jgi:RNA polymerase sigma-70 factor (ECF subfamily)